MRHERTKLTGCRKRVAHLRSPRVLVLCDYYLPSCHAGGPVQSLANLIAHLGDRISFRLITRDRDYGSTQPFDHAPRDTWTRYQGATVLYASPSRLNPYSIWCWIRSTPHDILYLNSYFSLWFTILPLAMRWLGLLPHSRIVIAPRGELASSALRQRSWKKGPFHRLARCLRLYHGVRWQATSPHEAADIRREVGQKSTITLAPALPRVGDPPSEIADENHISNDKEPGSLRILFLSRIHPIKNLRFAIDCLNGLRGQIEFTIHGPVQDRAYWADCLRELQRLPKNVEWRYAGPVSRDELTHVYHTHHVLLLPTQGENFGHVILEALLAGCGVIVSDRTPWRNLKRRGSGWDLSLDDIEPFRAALQEIVDFDQAQFRTFSAAALAQADAFCRDDQLIDQNLILFNAARYENAGMPSHAA